MFSYGTKATLHGGQHQWARTQGAAHHTLAVLALRRLPSRYIHGLHTSTIALISLTPLPLLYPPRAQRHSGKLFHHLLVYYVIVIISLKIIIKKVLVYYVIVVISLWHLKTHSIKYFYRFYKMFFSSIR